MGRGVKPLEGHHSTPNQSTAISIHFLYICISGLIRWKAILKKSIYSEEYTAFREMLRDTREKLHLSQEELGKRLGRHQPFIARIESGQRRLDVVEFIHMMRIMGVSSVSFLKKLEASIKKV